MAKKIAVMVLHGMGNQGPKEPDDSSKPTYSKKLHKAVRREIGARQFDDAIAWREVFYSHITQENQEIYFKKVRRRLNYDTTRNFVIKYLGDVAAYRCSPDDNKFNIYKDIHGQVNKTVEELKQDTNIKAPLIILAHSLGGHVISNHIYDLQKLQHAAPDISHFNTVAALVTFGCNIPLFTFGWAPQHIKAIKNPGSGLAPQLRQSTWWRNYYDKDDVLGYPLAPTGAGYKKLFENKELKDFKIDAGWFGASMTPFSHSLYWGDVDFVRPVAALLRKLANVA